MLDFAGGIVVHASAGFAVLASVMFIGRRAVVENKHTTFRSSPWAPVRWDCSVYRNANRSIATTIPMIATIALPTTAAAGAKVRIWPRPIASFIAMYRYAP